LEYHHIVMRANGGGDEPENTEWRCAPCHKYEHTRRSVEASLIYEQGRGQLDRIRCYEHRLEVLDNLNAVELIRERGTYLSYWTDRTTRYLHRTILTKEESEFQLQFNRLIFDAQLGEMK